LNYCGSLAGIAFMEQSPSNSSRSNCNHQQELDTQTLRTAETIGEKER
jgi:hypothetical protein